MLRKTLLLLVFIIFWLGIAELLVRLFGYHGWEPIKVPATNDILPDQELGWIKKFPKKPTKANSVATKPEVWVFGGSFVAAEGLNPDQSFTELLAKEHKQLRILNLGVNAYGSYQSLLLAQRLLNESEKPRIIIYGFVDFHEYRNIAHWQWLKSLAWNNSTGSVSLPYCRLNSENQTNCHSSRKYPFWPARKELALIPFLEEAYLRFGDISVLKQKEAVTVDIIEQFRDLCKENNVEFLVVQLSSINKDSNAYAKLLKHSNINYKNCIHPKGNSQEYILPSNGHPNALLNRHWAACLDPEFKKF